MTSNLTPIQHAERRVLEGERRIARLCELIDCARAAGRPVELAMELLDEFEKAQQHHVSRRSHMNAVRLKWAERNDELLPTLFN